MIMDAIINSQKGDCDSTLMLINKFNPLLKKYSRMLHYDDAYNDLLIDFLEMLHDIQTGNIRKKEDGGIVSYMTTTIRNSYIKRLSQAQKARGILFFSELSEDELFFVESTYSTTDTYSECDLPTLKKVLTKSELSVITAVYYMGYSITETAHLYGISRQAANQAKLRALSKMKAQYWDKPERGANSEFSDR